MAAGAAFGVPLGAWLLTKMDPLAVRWALAAMVAGLLLLLISGWRYQGRRTLPVTVGVGGFAGLLSGSVQIGGPPVVAFWLSSPLRPDVVRANIVLYFAVSSVYSGIAYLVSGLITQSVLALALIIGPAYGPRHLPGVPYVRPCERDHLPAHLLWTDRRSHGLEPPALRPGVTLTRGATGNRAGCPRSIAARRSEPEALT
jgi:uncharacterized membrane protein YfcA